MMRDGICKTASVDQSQYRCGIGQSDGMVLSLVYLTLATGHRDGEEGVHLNFIDRIKTEIVTAVFIAATSELIMLLSHVNNKTWNVSDFLLHRERSVC